MIILLPFESAIIDSAVSSSEATNSFIIATCEVSGLDRLVVAFIPAVVIVVVLVGVIAVVIIVVVVVPVVVLLVVVIAVVVVVVLLTVNISSPPALLELIEAGLN